MPTRLAARKCPSSCTNTSTLSDKDKRQNRIHAIILNTSTLGLYLARHLGNTREPIRRLLTAESVCTSTTWWAFMVRSMTWGIDANPIRPSKNLATATSFAALRTTGKAFFRPERLICQAQARKRIRVGHVEVEPTCARQIERRQ
mgnify:CR=1 FL=1